MKRMRCLTGMGAGAGAGAATGAGSAGLATPSIGTRLSTPVRISPRKGLNRRIPRPKPKAKAKAKAEPLVRPLPDCHPPSIGDRLTD